MTPEQEQIIGQEVKRRLDVYDELWDMLQAPPVEAVTRLTADRDALREALEFDAGALDALADRLDQWADESRKGGWSTHQVGANTEQANACRRRAARIREVLANLNQPDT